MKNTTIRKVVAYTLLTGLVAGSCLAMYQLRPVQKTVDEVARSSYDNVSAYTAGIFSSDEKNPSELEDSSVTPKEGK